MGQAMSHSDAPPPVVLVPPLFERDLRLRTRMAHSSYEYMFGKPALRFLLEDYMQPSARAWLNFRPAEDTRISVSAALDTPTSEPQRGTGVVNLRYQPDPQDYLNFFDIKAQARKGGIAKARACLFDPSSGLGGWVSMPLVQGSGERGLIGMRYGSATLTFGLVVSPTTQTLEKLWLGGQQGALSFGVQTSPGQSLDSLAAKSGLQSLGEACQNHMSYSIAYTPVATNTVPGRGTFTAAVEVKDQRQMLVSFLYHLALQRNIRNPFEGSDVVAITNYLDVGLQVATDYASANGDTPPLNGAALGVAWQANRGLLLKAKISSDSIGAAVAVKSWAQPSWTAAASATWVYGSSSPKLGLTFGVENHGNVRYERSKDSTPRGSSVVQRHYAMQEDIDNSEGKGRLVPPSQMDDPEVLGQVPRPADRVL
jgi:hypothetical protein